MYTFSPLFRVGSAKCPWEKVQLSPRLGEDALSPKDFSGRKCNSPHGRKCILPQWAKLHFLPRFTDDWEEMHFLPFWEKVQVRPLGKVALLPKMSIMIIMFNFYYFYKF